MLWRISKGRRLESSTGEVALRCRGRQVLGGQRPCGPRVGSYLGWRG